MLQTKNLRGWFKIGGLFFIIVFFILFYLIMINTTSTKGYFLRQSMRELDDVKFRHNVTAFQLAIIQRQLWNKVNVDFIGQWDSNIQKQESPIIQLEISQS